jgi:predicted dehydrogenase
MSKRTFSPGPGTLTRRRFIYTSALAAGTLAAGTYAAGARAKFKSPNDRLAFGIIGYGGKGRQDSLMMSFGNDIVAVCDVDDRNLAEAQSKWPKARTYKDYRVMLDKEQNNIDAVTVSTPDHQHAPPTLLAMQAGKHVHCQKPLAHSVSEVHAVTEAAKKYGVATQMGNQGHSSDDIRLCCEMIQSGAIGPVHEVHCWTDRPKRWWAQGYTRPPGSDPVPDFLDWDMWLGSSPTRPFLDHWPGATDQNGNPIHIPVYHPFVWRGWWDFGCGALGDMACHVMDAAYWSLKLGAPDSIELVDSSTILSDMGPNWSIIRYNFPARGDMPKCSVTWYDGGKVPPRPKEMEAEEFGSSGTIFIGEKGKMMTGEYSDNPRLLPESSMLDYKKPPRTIPRIGENNKVFADFVASQNADPTDPRLQVYLSYSDFIRACKGGPPACSRFEVSGPFSEIVVLGNLVLRLGQKKIEWDSANMKVKDNPDADQLIRPTYRKGWMPVV